MCLTWRNRGIINAIKLNKNTIMNQKHTTLSKLLPVLMLIPALAHAEPSSPDSADHALACESQITLPAGHHFVHQTEDCQYNENLAVIKKGSLYGYANAEGKIVIEPQFDFADSFDDGLALIKQDGKYGFINPKGTLVIKPKFDDAWGFWEGRAKIKQDGKYGFIDKKGKVIIAARYPNTGDWFENGLVRVQIDGKWGYLNKDGKTIVAPTFDTAEDFSEGLASIGIKGSDGYKYGHINPKGELIIPAIYDAPANFIDGLAFVIKDSRAYYIDKTGKETTLKH